MTKAIVLLSGGVDSATALAVARHERYELYALSFDYGQRHLSELACAARQAAAARAIHTVVRMSSFGGSALLGSSPVPKGGPTTGIPPTYVPARNTIFLSYALALAEVLKARDIFIGVNAVDYSGYPDCRPEYLAAFAAMANLATKAGIEGHGVTIQAPLINMTKRQIILTGQGLGVDFAATSSCYDPTPAGACGACDSCRIRLAGFAAAGLRDPATYR